jgi:lysozyme family protein
MFTQAFIKAVSHAMTYEVGPFDENDPETVSGLISTQTQRRKVGYTNDPVDAGGETKFGVAKSGNPNTNITSLTWPEAQQIYYDRYWIAGGCQLLSPRLAVLHFDGCVNHGVSRASKFLQEVIGANQDGQVGPATAKLANSKNDLEVCSLLADRREKFYRAIVASNPVQARFLNGWLRRINEMREFVKSTFNN